MNNLDKNYLLLQFKDRIHSKNGTEFQSFFEDIMEKAFPDFKKVPSGGGDGGNDGWIKEKGRYYQVYAPNTPATKDSEAANKLRKNFKSLKDNWNRVAEIKEYYFAFNDKYFGSQKPEKVIAELKKENPDIEFKTFLAKDLENLFFSLKESDILSLGFDIDKRQAVSIVYEYLDNVKIELDLENSIFAAKRLEDSHSIIAILGDGDLILEYEILESRCLQKLEKVDEAKKKYENISKRFPKDPRAILYLAEIHLNDKDFDKNRELLEEANKINSDYWLLKLEQLVRKRHLEEEIPSTEIDETVFPNDPIIKANFYRLYAPFIEDSGDEQKADRFIEKAIHLNPDRFSNYVTKLSLLESRLISDQDVSKRLQGSQILLKEIEMVEGKFLEYGNIGARNRALLNAKKMNALILQRNVYELFRISKETFQLSISCYFDKQIEQILIAALKLISLPNDDLAQLLKYLKRPKKEISDELLKVLIFQFIFADSLFTQGKQFLEETNNRKYVDFIVALENQEHKKVLEFLKQDSQFAVIIASTLKNSPDLRRKIIEGLPDEKNINKAKLQLLLNYDEKDFDEAFDILKKLDLSSLSYFECKPILKVIQKKRAYDFEVIILNSLLDKERSKTEKFKLKLQLFNAFMNLEKYPEVIDTGEQLLQEDSDENILDTRNKEALLGNTMIACLERGKIDNKEFSRSIRLLNKYQLIEPSFEFKVGIEAQAYLNNNEEEKALESVIEGVKIKKVLSQKEYAELYFTLAVEIGNRTSLNLNPEKSVREDTFVKIKNKNQWYFIGDNDELDAIPITKTKEKYKLFIDKKIGDRIILENEYGSEKHEYELENILPIEKYILWQTVQHFQRLAKDGDLDGVQAIEVPKKDDSIDPSYLLKFLENQKQSTEQFFEIYCQKRIPLSLLAVNEGGLMNAIGRIQQENKGFINFSTGTAKEYEKQKEMARKVIHKDMQFYIDGTSALVLSESGLFKRIYPHLSNMKVPQSVISLLVNLCEKFRYMPERAGYMGYAHDKIIFSSIEKEKRELIQSNFVESIKLIEIKPQNIEVISSANKADCLSEQQVPAETCDACILAQKESIPILTEDYLYLRMNEWQTEKETPEYFSSLALVRVLYEENEISFDDYIDFFSYLSSYRFRFLSLNANDIEKAVFGDGRIKIINPMNIRKLNFSLTLSEEYGVSFQIALTVVGEFLLKVLLDNSITSHIAERIFIEIIESLPKDKNKKEFAKMLLMICRAAMKNRKPEFVLYSEDHQVQEKMKKLFRATEIYNSTRKLWIPNKE